MHLPQTALTLLWYKLAILAYHGVALAADLREAFRTQRRERDFPRFVADRTLSRLRRLLARAAGGGPALALRRSGPALLAAVTTVLVMGLPAAELLLTGDVPGPTAVSGGGVLFAGAVYVRLRAHLDAPRGRARSSAGARGIYATIRHPMALSLVLFVAACPAVLAARYSFVLAAAGIASVALATTARDVARSRASSRYRDYARGSWMLMPWVY
jgi:protein-S-isoprenylcysteine O-methyltransferase Ste14